MRDNGAERVIEKGKLYIVSTPIGNLEDISIRGLKILQKVKLVAAEDTRHTATLLKRFNISKPLISYYDAVEDIKADRILAVIERGEDVAVVSDAGTPCISDPAYRLIRKAIAKGIKPIPIPGPSAVISGLIVSGIPCDRFIFEGFLPRKKGKRTKRLQALAGEERTVVLFESPLRINILLSEIKEHIGDREIVIAREITKIHEEFISGKVDEVLKLLAERKIKGEITLIIKGRDS